MMRTEQHYDKQEVAPVHLVAEVPYAQRGWGSDCKEGRRDIATQIPASSCHCSRSFPISPIERALLSCPCALPAATPVQLSNSPLQMRRCSHMCKTIIGSAQEIGTAQGCKQWKIAHLVFCSSSKPNSSAMSERLGAIRFWSAYSSEAVSVNIVTM